jgi:hypothetical protein
MHISGVPTVFGKDGRGAFQGNTTIPLTYKSLIDTISITYKCKAVIIEDQKTP